MIKEARELNLNEERKNPPAVMPNQGGYRRIVIKPEVPLEARAKMVSKILTPLKTLNPDFHILTFDSKDRTLISIKTRNSSLSRTIKRGDTFNSILGHITDSIQDNLIQGEIFDEILSQFLDMLRNAIARFDPGNNEFDSFHYFLRVFVSDMGRDDFTAAEQFNGVGLDAPYGSIDILSLEVTNIRARGISDKEVKSGSGVLISGPTRDENFILNPDICDLRSKSLVKVPNHFNNENTTKCLRDQ